jgi:hypothetical protein
MLFNSNPKMFEMRVKICSKGENFDLKASIASLSKFNISYFYALVNVM